MYIYIPKNETSLFPEMCARKLYKPTLRLYGVINIFLYAILIQRNELNKNLNVFLILHIGLATVSINFLLILIF